MIIEQNGKTYRVVKELDLKPHLLDIAAQLRAARAVASMTLKQAAEASGVCVSTISQAERSLMAPSLETLTKLCAVYGCEFVIRGK